MELGLIFEKYDTLTKEQLDRQNQLLEEFYNNIYYENRLTRVEKYNLDKIETFYYLLWLEEPKVFDFPSNVKIENIVSLPKKLYLLRLLENDDLHLIGDENISQQINLFNIKYSETVEIEKLLHSINTGLVTGSRESINSIVNCRQKVLRKHRDYRKQ